RCRSAGLSVRRKVGSPSDPPDRSARCPRGTTLVRFASAPTALDGEAAMLEDRGSSADRTMIEKVHITAALRRKPRHGPWNRWQPHIRIATLQERDKGKR